MSGVSLISGVFLVSGVSLISGVSLTFSVSNNSYAFLNSDVLCLTLCLVVVVFVSPCVRWWSSLSHLVSGGGRLAIFTELVEQKEHHSVTVLNEPLETNNL